MVSSRTKSTTLDLLYIALSAVLITVCAWVAIPLVIPFTLQTMAVFIIAGLFGSKRATFAVLIYLLLGLVGVPVFAGFAAGPGVLFGPTGGYMVGFIFMALIIGLISKKWGKSPLVLTIAMLVGIVICYLFGTCWFVLVYLPSGQAISFGAALMLCVVPYIIPDLAKIAVAVFLVKRLSAHVKN